MEDFCCIYSSVNIYLLITKNIDKRSQERLEVEMQTSNNHLKPHVIPLKGQNSTISTIKMAKKCLADEEEENILQQSLKLIEQLYQMRFIEKISRPILRKEKEEYVEKFAGKMENLHNKLDRIKNQLANKFAPEIANNKYRSVVGSVTNRPMDWKKSIKTIQNRYVEVLYEGSFKHYTKLNQMYNFSYPLLTIKIEEWSSQCLDKKNKQSCC